MTEKTWENWGKNSGKINNITVDPEKGTAIVETYLVSSYGGREYNHKTKEVSIREAILMALKDAERFWEIDSLRIFAAKYGVKIP